MKKLLSVAVSILFATVATVAMAECVDGVWRGPWAGPSPVPPSCEEPIPEDLSVLCFPEACNEVEYGWTGAFRIAKSKLPNGYEVLGWSGPCYSGACPEIDTQAYSDLWWNARQANRAQRYRP